MSYILEALRRAESERERKRGGVPGLHAQPVPMPSPDDAGERRGAPWRWIATGLTVGVLAMILWRWWSVEPLVDEAAIARAPVEGNVSQGGAAPPAAAAPAPAADATPAATASVPNATPRPEAATTPAKTVAPPPAEKAPRTGKPATPPRSTATASRRDEPTQTPAPAKAATRTGGAPPAPAAQTAPAAAPPAPPPERLRTLAELPDDLRSSVPQLAFGGSVYSDTPAQRMVIFNGQVMREGDAVTNELQIEQIRPRSAVLRVRGQRFEMPF